MHPTRLVLGNEGEMGEHEYNKTETSWPVVVFVVLMVIGICFVAWLNFGGME